MKKYVVAVGAYVVVLALMVMFLRTVPDDLRPLDTLQADIGRGVVERIEQGNPRSKVVLRDGSSYELETSRDLDDLVDLSSVPEVTARSHQVLRDASTFAITLVPFLLIALALMAFRDWRHNRSTGLPAAT